jgi:hypothetical protein
MVKSTIHQLASTGWTDETSGWMVETSVRTFFTGKLGIVK